MTSPLIEAEDLTLMFGGGWTLLFGQRPETRALAGISLRIEAGESVGILGESGSGKSTLARCLCGLYAPTAGMVRLDGTPMTPLDGRRRRALARAVQLVFQDPRSSLNPRHCVGQPIERALALRGGLRGDALRAGVRAAFEEVGLDPTLARRLPTDLSGGQAQRVALARALALGPRLLILDEALSALDSATRRALIGLLRTVRSQRGLTYLFISHDVALVAALCDRVAVMRRGEVVEYGPVARVIGRPSHAYTATLLDAVPCIAR